MLGEDKWTFLSQPNHSIVCKEVDGEMWPF